MNTFVRMLIPVVAAIHIALLLTVLSLFGTPPFCQGFPILSSTHSPTSSTQTSTSKLLYMEHPRHTLHDADDAKFESRSRRTLLSQGSVPLMLLLLTSSTADCTTDHCAIQPVWANDDALFRPNPLTNGVLEQLRIWEQAEADNLKYGGELERGDAGNRGQISAYPKLLVPILVLSNEIQSINDAVQRKQYNDAFQLLQQNRYDKITFKRVFNAYADNVYYSDPDRANLYLGGGATPKIEQSLAYLLRNEILTNLENLQAELKYYIKSTTTTTTSSSSSSSTVTTTDGKNTPIQNTLQEDLKENEEDIILYAKAANDAMQRYLEIVPPNELKQAKAFLVDTTTNNR